MKFICKPVALRASQLEKSSRFYVKVFLVVVSRNSDHNWPPKLCNLTPPVFFPNQWKHNIRMALDEIGPQI